MERLNCIENLRSLWFDKKSPTKRGTGITNIVHMHIKLVKIFLACFTAPDYCSKSGLLSS